MPPRQELTKPKLADLLDLVGHFEARKLRAQEHRLQAKGRHWYFAVVGLKMESDSIGIEPLARFSRVLEPPGEIELAAACNNSTIFGAVARYSKGIEFELEVNRDGVSDQGAFNLAWWILSALRIRTCAEVLVVAVADHSWSTIAAVDDRTCHVQLLEDHPRSRLFSEVRVITKDDIDWVARHVVSLGELLEKRQFRLAVDSFCSHNQAVSTRMAGAMLWAGIEALFSISSELRFRLAAYVATTLEERGRDRVECYRRVKRLYDFRSRLIHGAAVQEKAIIDHLVEVRLLLSRLICQVAETGKIREEPEIEELLFG